MLMVLMPRKPASLQAGMISTVPRSSPAPTAWTWRGGTVASCAKASRSAGTRPSKSRWLRVWSASRIFMAGVRSLRGQCSAQAPDFSLVLNFPIITDPQFYAVAVPAVLLLGVSKSGFGAGFGSLAVPLMALSVTVPQAAAILMPILFVMDVMGLAAFRRNFDWPLLKFLVPMGLVGTV